MTWLVDRVVALLRWLERPRLPPLPPTQTVSEHWLKTHFYTDGKETRE
jgi:hypothetical protein